MKHAPASSPLIVLGDHGFLPQYGSRLSEEDVLARMRYALRLGIPALAAGELHISTCAMEAFRLEGVPSRWVRHVDVPVSASSGKKLAQGPAFALLRELALDRLGSSLNNDLVMGPFFDSCKATPPLRQPAESLEIDAHALAAIVEDIVSRRPTLVTAGGDWLDFLLACRREDLVTEFLNLIGAAAREARSQFHLCTYLGFAWGKPFQQFADRIDVSGFMVTVNALGAGMLPNPTILLQAIRSRRKAISAMHVLLFGRLEIEHALRAATSSGAEYLIVGASQEKHIKLLARAAAQLHAGQDATS